MKWWIGGTITMLPYDVLSTLSGKGLCWSTWLRSSPDDRWKIHIKLYLDCLQLHCIRGGVVKQSNTRYFYLQNLSGVRHVYRTTGVLFRCDLTIEVRLHSVHIDHFREEHEAVAATWNPRLHFHLLSLSKGHFRKYTGAQLRRENWRMNRGKNPIITLIDRSE